MKKTKHVYFDVVQHWDVYWMKFFLSRICDIRYKSIGVMRHES